MRLYLIRHADPDYPNNTITPAGHREAAALADRLATEGITRVYSSPLGRAIDTGRYAAEKLGFDMPIEEWTCEHRDCLVETGLWGTTAMFNVPGEVVRAGNPVELDWRKIPYLDDDRFHKIVEAMQESSDGFMARHGFERTGGRYRVREWSDERIAVFCHGGFGLTWLAHLLELPLALVWCGFWLPPSSVTTLVMERRSEEWAVPRCIGVGDTSHLYAAGLPVRPRGLAENWSG